MFIFTFMKTFPPFLKKLLLLTSMGILIFVIWITWSLFAPKTTENPYTMSYSVVEGETFNQVLHDLENVQILRSYWAPKLVQSLFGFSLKKGEYEISPHMSAWNILKTLSVGKAPLVKLTFPEGFSIQDMAARLQANGFTNTQDFLSVSQDPAFLKSLGIPAPSAEGFLFPSTYYVPKAITSSELIKLMLKTFLEKISPFHPDTESLAKIYPTLILASIIEKEAVVEKDRPVIASVFLNRIQKRMRLESCATIIYIFETRGVKKNRVYYKDLQVDSPFNTYKHLGLPPTPISNPGLDSLKAAFDPAHTDYLFFAYKGNGEHLFSNNYEDHMRAYKKYIQYQNIKKT